MISLADRDMTLTRQRDAQACGVDRLRAVVMLAGSMRATPLKTFTGRNLLDLPVTPVESVLDQWRLELAFAADRLGLGMLPVRVMVERGAYAPRPVQGDHLLAMSIEEDPGDFRGTGGLLSDIARDYDDQDLLLVAAGAQVLMGAIEPEVRRLVAAAADLAMLVTATGAPAGLLLVRCGALRAIKAKGFVDLKEQALPQIAAEHDVRVVRTAAPVGRPIRRLDDYISALRRFVRQARGMPPVDPWFAQEWRSTFSLVELGAEVDDSAVVHDAVVLAGATVKPGAVVVRSLVGEGAVIHSGQSVIDQVVGSGGAGRMPSPSARERRRS
jgi:hypothetical protein